MALSRQIFCLGNRLTLSSTAIFANKYALVALPSVSVRGYADTYYKEPPYSGFKYDPIRDDSPVVSHPKVYSDVDPAPLFMNKSVQKLLARLSGCDKEKIFRHRKVAKKLSPPKYVYLTDEQLQEAQEESERKAKRLLQMPPVMRVRSEEAKVICRDPALSGLETHKWVFTDISLDVHDRNRLIVVRETDGTLRHAVPEERHRMNQIYNPRKGRSINMPEMFQQNRLNAVLDRQQYEFVLDRACMHMEPDNPVFQSVAANTYEAVDAARSYDALHSTRHFGPMVFYLTWHKMADGLLEFLVNKERLSDAGDLVRLFTSLHPSSQLASAVVALEKSEDIELVKVYIREVSRESGPLQLAVKQHTDLVRAREDYERKANLAVAANVTTTEAS